MKPAGLLFARFTLDCQVYPPDDIDLDDVSLQDKVAQWANEFVRLIPALTLLDRYYIQMGVAAQAWEEKEHAMKELSAQLVENMHTMDELPSQLAEKDTQLDKIINSKSWKIVLFFHGIIFPCKINERNRKIKENVLLIKSSGLFDETWYLANNPDVAQAKVNPALHYLCYGGLEGRDPRSII